METSAHSTPKMPIAAEREASDASDRIIALLSRARFRFCGSLDAPHQSRQPPNQCDANHGVGILTKTALLHATYRLTELAEMADEVVPETGRCMI